MWKPKAKSTERYAEVIYQRFEELKDDGKLKAYKQISKEMGISYRHVQRYVKYIEKSKETTS